MPSLDPQGDEDGDQFLNGVEEQAGSDPRNPLSTPESQQFNTCQDQLDNDLDGLHGRD